MPLTPDVSSDLRKLCTDAANACKRHQPFTNEVHNVQIECFGPDYKVSVKIGGQPPQKFAVSNPKDTVEQIMEMLEREVQL